MVRFKWFSGSQFDSGSVRSKFYVIPHPPGTVFQPPVIGSLATQQSTSSQYRLWLSKLVQERLAGIWQGLNRDSHQCVYQTWGQFHFGNSTQFHLINSNSLIPNLSIQIPFLPTLFYLLLFTTSRYSEYLPRVPTCNTYSEQFIFQVGLSWKK